MTKTMKVVILGMLFGVMSTLSAESMKCGAGKCGASMQAKPVKKVENIKPKCCTEKEMKKPTCCEVEKKAPKKEAMKCGTGKCA